MGASEQASAIRRASDSSASSRFSGRGGWGLRDGAASNPSSEKRRRALSTVTSLTAASRATWASDGPSSALGRIRARAISRPGETPEETFLPRKARYSPVRPTLYLSLMSPFYDDIAKKEG